MNEDTAQELKRLVRLQKVELERTRLTAALKALPVEVANADNLLKAAQKQVADTQAGLKREELLRASQELEVAGHKVKASRLRAQLDTAQNAAQATAFEHGISFAEKEIGRLEDGEFASLERTETLESTLAKARILAATLTETVGLIRARVAEQQLEFTEQLAAFKTERETLRTELATFDEGARLRHFDRIAGSRGTGLAKAEGQQCSGCRMGIRPQMWNQLRDGAVIPCESCNRILYFDPTMQAEPARPKSVAGDAALGGASIRNRQAGA
jgi:predicted  nucleic acid-binding Zn-ribbon protein